MYSTQNVIIRCYNRSQNVTYIYFGHSKYDDEGKCTTKGARKCIGKINVQGEFEPNKAFLLMKPEDQLSTGLVNEPYYPPVDTALISKGDIVEKFYGYTAIIESVAKDTGVYSSLKKVFPLNYLAIMSMVESLMCFPERNLYSQERMHKTCWHTNLDKLTEGDITRALEEMCIKENSERFFSEMNKKRSSDNDFVIALDTTSISTYSTMLHLAKYGYNKEGDSLPQVNLLMACDYERGIPVYYRALDGNTSDKKTVEATIDDMKYNGIPKNSVICMDRGFCTEENMQLLLKNGYSFLMCIPEKGPYYADAIESSYSNIEDTKNYIKSIDRYCVTSKVDIPCSRRGCGANSYPMALHVSRDLEAHAEQKQKLTAKFIEGLEKLNENPSLYDGNNKWYKKYYTIETEGTKKTPTVFTHNTKAQEEAKCKSGLYVMISPPSWSAEKASVMYSKRDVVEKDFECWKDKMRRPRHSLDEHLEGKIFLVYLLTIIEAAMRDIARRYLLDTNCSFQDIVDKIFSCKWRKKDGQLFKDGQWIDMTAEEIKLLHIFGVEGMSKLMTDVDNEVQKDLLHRQGLKAKRGRKKKTQ